MPASSPSASATTSPGPQAVVVALPAEIDITNDEDVRDALTQALRGGAKVVIVDASQTIFCGCAGVTALCHAHGAAAETGAQLRIAASPVMRRILELTCADQFLDIYDTVDAAGNEQAPHRPATGEATFQSTSLLFITNTRLERLAP